MDTTPGRDTLMGYFERALVLAVLIGAITGLGGAVVVMRGRVFFAQALTHATFPGAVVAATLGVNILLGAGVSGIALVGLMLLLERRREISRNVSAGLVLTSGFALGIALQSLNPQIPVRPESVLLGSLFFAPPASLPIAAGALAVVVTILVIARRPLLFSTFDVAGFRAAGGREAIIETAVLTVVVLASVVAIPAAGAILTIALLAGPATAARLLTRTWGAMIILAPTLSIAAAVIGTILSRSLGVSAGGAIALLAGCEFLLALGVARLLHRRSAAEPKSRRTIISSVYAR
ncbi:metal ABC transporter permease [Microbacterium xanthum]|uniref:metal ABC transporter permease n=1 Tax=Microbacterium xanthum TaxID=3079794 RepID=UPI002AD51293|nr:MULTISPECIES: metal ABC transporter permease [unclassified Microbacterium]MDZ8171767.1 metal ABC transporter permease [Microbacterium sp. KSW-48]MDZ8200130.1 metal ABC transporter permease [Microbacterium sp. SSW1-59]